MIAVADMCDHCDEPAVSTKDVDGHLCRGHREELAHALTLLPAPARAPTLASLLETIRPGKAA